MQTIADATGWVFFVSAGGPNPSDGGHIYMENYYFGPLTTVGNDFERSYVGFQEGFQEPFATHTKNCFPKHVRHARALRTGGMQNVDEESTTVARLSSEVIRLPKSPSQIKEPSMPVGAPDVITGEGNQPEGRPGVVDKIVDNDKCGNDDVDDQDKHGNNDDGD